MDFKKIQKNIKIHKYRCLDDIDADMALLCKNAQNYNIEGSLVSVIRCLYALLLHTLIVTKILLRVF